MRKLFLLIFLALILFYIPTISCVEQGGKKQAGEEVGTKEHAGEEVGTQEHGGKEHAGEEVGGQE